MDYFIEQMVGTITFIWPCFRIFTSSIWNCTPESSHGCCLLSHPSDIIFMLPAHGGIHWPLYPVSPDLRSSSLLIPLPCHIFFVELNILGDQTYLLFYLFIGFLSHYDMDSRRAVILFCFQQNPQGLHKCLEHSRIP